jgi:hypothetical protein
MVGQPTKAEKAQLIATCSNGFKLAPDALTIYNEESTKDETFHEWARRKGKAEAMLIYKSIK